MSTKHYDVIIIGSGAGGGTLAYRLAPSGARVLILERGDYVRREKDHWDSHAVNVAAKYHTRESWTDADGRPLHPHTNYYVGGNTQFYGAALFRVCRGAVRGGRVMFLARCSPAGACPRRARWVRTLWSRITPRPSGCTTCTARAVR